MLLSCPNILPNCKKNSLSFCFSTGSLCSCFSNISDLNAWNRFSDSSNSLSCCFCISNSLSWHVFGRPFSLYCFGFRSSSNSSTKASLSWDSFKSSVSNLFLVLFVFLKFVFLKVKLYHHQHDIQGVIVQALQPRQVRKHGGGFTTFLTLNTRSKFS